MSRKSKSLFMLVILTIVGNTIYSIKSLNWIIPMYIYLVGWCIITAINWLENVERSLTEERVLIGTGIIIFFISVPANVLKFIGVWILAGVVALIGYNVYKHCKKDKSKNDFTKD